MYVLVVDDDKDLREALRDVLMLEGCEAVCVEDGGEALRLLRAGKRPGLILLDLIMPVMDGWAFRRAMLRDPALAGIPVAVMTAASAQRASGLGAVTVLQKPLELDTVIDLVQSHCARNRG